MESQNNKPGQMTLTVREQQDDEIDLVALFYLLWGHMLQIIACVIVGGAAAFAYTYFMVTPLYQATSKMYVASATYNLCLYLLYGDAALSGDIQNVCGVGNL